MCAGHGLWDAAGSQKQQAFLKTRRCAGRVLCKADHFSGLWLGKKPIALGVGHRPFGLLSTDVCDGPVSFTWNSD